MGRYSSVGDEFLLVVEGGSCGAAAGPRCLGPGPARGFAPGSPPPTQRTRAPHQAATNPVKTRRSATVSPSELHDHPDRQQRRRQRPPTASLAPWRKAPALTAPAPPRAVAATRSRPGAQEPGRAPPCHVL